MGHWNTWDVVVLVAAGYIAVMALVRLMRSHRAKLVDQLQQKWLAEQRRKQEEQQLERKRKAKEERKRKENERRQRRPGEAA